MTATHIPLSLYIHFPWCRQKCLYCDFNAHALKDSIPEEQYLQRLLQDLDLSLAYAQNRPLHSIFMGGGTPSLFSPRSIAYLLEEINKRLHCSSDIEITMEANPGTVDEQNFRGFLAAGVNRLSLGIQSFQAAQLKTLGRIHDEQGAHRAIKAALQAGFHNFNLDLMHGLPNQTPEEAMSDLTQALAYDPPHLSWYQLTIEPNTVFYKTKPALPVDDALAEIQDQGEALLAAHGYDHYEISAFARQNQVSQHNMNYWQFGDYMGIGAGAHEKLSSACPELITRRWRMRQPKDYLDLSKPIIAGSEAIAREQLPFEFMMNAMRLKQPIQRSCFETRTGLSWDCLLPTLQIASDKQFIEYDESSISVTPFGRRFLNDLLALWLP
jgi:oxygen-independent coproporphyrinogen-3 oxidase